MKGSKIGCMKTFDANIFCKRSFFYKQVMLFGGFFSYGCEIY